MPGAHCFGKKENIGGHGSGRVYPPYVVTPFKGLQDKLENADLPYVNWDTTYQHYDYYHGYTKLEKEGTTPAIPFGFGMSYTTFAYSDCAR